MRGDATRSPRGARDKPLGPTDPPDPRCLHNAVDDPGSRLGRLVRLVHGNDGLRVENNLLSGPGPRVETDSRVTLRNNHVGDLTGVFVTDSSEVN